MIEPDPRSSQADPGRAAAEAGQVLLDGPDGVAIAMVPEAAEETGHRLIAAAEQARAQGEEPTPQD